MNMTWFIGRQEELQALETAYQKDSFQLGILYGRRRIGKTTLLRQFCTGERAVFFTARNTTTERNVELFGQCAAKALDRDRGTASFQSFEELCDFLGTQSQNERIIVVIDEFPYLAGKDKSILSTLQKYIDEQWQPGKMFLILCGSSDGFMEKEVLGPKSLLSGRSTMQMKLEAFDYRQSALFLPSWSAYDQAVAYGLTGGVAQYISLFDENKSLEENIVSLFFSKSGWNPAPYTLIFLDTLPGLLKEPGDKVMIATASAGVAAIASLKASLP
jgi:AAA+ ATPase superfamily predicted ATPase